MQSSLSHAKWGHLGAIIEGRYVTLQTEEGWARVRLVWDKQYETHKIRKRKTIFAKS